ncbi:MAG: hypothetical protein M3R30_06990 [Candidatus Eremiobacteraeota bacterium]|nr:hypothetical protein [Candidatus Eremiobacteraeota bacterium]
MPVVLERQAGLHEIHFAFILMKPAAKKPATKKPAAKPMTKATKKP